MIDLQQIFKRKRVSSILGVALDGSRLEVVSLRRNNGTLHVRQSLVATLALSPLTDAAELVGQEIRNHLDQAGIRERNCVVCLPLSWIMSLQAQVPELSEADRASFLQLEAERGFHSGPETLLTVNSIFKTPGGEQHATLLAVPRNQLEALRTRPARGQTQARPFRARHDRPAIGHGPSRDASFSWPCAAIQLTCKSRPAAALPPLRSLDGAIETQGAQKTIAADFIARELRITLGQLPNGLAQTPGRLKIFGQGELAKQLVNDLSPRIAAMGLKLEVTDKASAAQFDAPLPADIAGSTALALAANYVLGVDCQPDFLPPKVQPWRQLVATRLSPRKLAWVGGAAAAAVFCVIVAFGVQQWEIVSLQSKWKAIEPTVNELNGDQDQIAKFLPWYDTSFRDLQILRKLKDTFPGRRHRLGQEGGDSRCFQRDLFRGGAR